MTSTHDKMANVLEKKCLILVGGNNKQIKKINMLAMKIYHLLRVYLFCTNTIHPKTIDYSDFLNALSAMFLVLKIMMAMLPLWIEQNNKLNMIYNLVVNLAKPDLIPKDMFYTHYLSENMVEFREYEKQIKSMLTQDVVDKSISFEWKNFADEMKKMYHNIDFYVMNLFIFVFDVSGNVFNVEFSYDTYNSNEKELKNDVARICKMEKFKSDINCTFTVKDELMEYMRCCDLTSQVTTRRRNELELEL